MSIPSIKFPMRNRPGPPLNQKSKVKLALSSSYSDYSYGSDIPSIGAVDADETPSRTAFLSSASLESEEDYPAHEVDWKAKTKNPAAKNQNNNINNNINNNKNMQVQRKIEIDDFDSNSSDNAFIFKPNNDNNNASINPNNSNEMNGSQQNTIAQSQNQISTPVTANSNNNTSSLQLSPEVQTTDSANSNEKNSHKNKISSFLVFRQSSKKGKFRMEENSKVVFFGSESKDSKGKIFQITTTAPISSKIQNDSLKGFVRIDSGHDAFTVYTTEEKFNDDREGELCGIEIGTETAHQPSSSKKKCKKVKILITKDGKPHYPISRRKSLSKIIQVFSKNQDKNAQENGQIDFPSNLESSYSTLKLDRFDYFESINPSTSPPDDDKQKAEELSKLFINPSSKNFIIRDKDDNTLLILYKIASDSFHVSFCKPITPIIAFGISMSVISAGS